MGTRVYVGNLPSNSTREDVERIFDKYGRISRLDVKTPREGLPAFAFLEFEDPRDAEDAIRGRDNYDVDGVRLRVQIARGGHVSAASRGPPQRSEFRVRVLGLPNSASWQDLKDHMRKAGEVGYTDISRDREGMRVGVVEYTRREDMENALRTLDRTEFANRFDDRSEIRVEEDRGPAPPMAGGFGGGGGYPPRDAPGGGYGGRGRDEYRGRDDYRGGGGGGGGGYDRGREYGGYGGGHDRYRDDRADRRSRSRDRDYDRGRDSRRSRSRSRSRNRYH